MSISGIQQLRLLRQIRSLLSLQCLPVRREYFPLPSRDEWKTIIELSSQGLALPALYEAVSNKRLKKNIDEAVLSALKFFFDFNIKRNAQIREQIFEITTALNQVGVKPVWLKGATVLLDNGWEDSGRVMVDLDLWIPNESEHRSALEALHSLGYQYIDLDRSKYPDLDAHHHFTPLQKQGRIVPLEVHKQVLSKAYQPLLPDALIMAEVNWFDWRNLSLGILGKPHQAIQSLVQCLEEGRYFWLRSENSCLMKVADLHRRLIAMNSEERAQFNSVLQGSMVEVAAKPLFVMMSRDFGDRSVFEIHPSKFFLNELFYYWIYFPILKMQRQYPRQFYILFMLKAAYRSIRVHGIKGMQTWPRKMKNHLQKLKTFD